MSFPEADKLMARAQAMLRQVMNACWQQYDALAQFAGEDSPVIKRQRRACDDLDEAVGLLEQARDVAFKGWDADSKESLARGMRAAFALAMAPPEKVRELAEFQLKIVNPAALAKLKAEEVQS